MGHYLPNCGNVQDLFCGRGSGDECVCGDTLVSSNNDKSTNIESSAYFDCFKHLYDLLSDASYFNEINYFDSINSSSVAKFTSAKQKMMNSSNFYFHQVTLMVLPLTNTVSTKKTLVNFCALPKY